MGFTLRPLRRLRTVSEYLPVRRLLIVVIGLWVLLVSAPASAQRIVLLDPKSNDALLQNAFYRLQAELTIHKFETSIADDLLTAEPSQALISAANRADAIACLALVRGDNANVVNIWLADRLSGKVTLRVLQVQPSDDAANILAIRAVDLLRESLREFSQRDKPPADVINVHHGAVPAAVRELTRTPEPSFAMLAGALALYEHPQLGFGAGPLLGASYRISRAWRTSVSFAGPVTGVKFVTSEGFATLRQELGWLGLSWDFLRAGHWRLGFEAMGGLWFVQAQGQPKAPLFSLSDNVWASLWGAGFCSQYALGQRIGIEFSVKAMGTLPPLRVALYDQESALSAPILAASIGLSVAP